MTDGMFDWNKLQNTSTMEELENTSEVLCDKMISAWVKGTAHKTVARSEMMYGAEALPIKKAQGSEEIRSRQNENVKMDVWGLWDIKK